MIKKKKNQLYHICVLCFYVCICARLLLISPGAQCLNSSVWVCCLHTFIDVIRVLQSALFKVGHFIICLYKKAALSSWHASLMFMCVCVRACMCRCLIYRKEPLSPCLHNGSKHFTVPWRRESPFPPTSTAAVCLRKRQILTHTHTHTLQLLPWIMKHDPLDITS